jgi:transposase
LASRKLVRRIHPVPVPLPHPRLRYKAQLPTRRCSYRGTHDVGYRCRSIGSARDRCRHCGGDRLDVWTPASVAIGAAGSRFRLSGPAHA